MNKKTIVTYLVILTKYLLSPLSIILLFLLAYQPLSHEYGGVGYGWNKNSLVEIPLELFVVTIGYYVMFFILKNNRYRQLLALLPIASFYIFYDYYFNSLGKVFKICDLSEIPELIDVLPFWQITMYVTLLLHIAFIIGINLQRIWYYYLPLVFVITFTFITVTIQPSIYLDDIFKKNIKHGIIPWSDQGTAQNGYLSSLLYFEAMMTQSKSLATELYGDGIEYEKSQAQLTDFLKQKNNKHNVHIIIMESFFNPILFKKISYDNPVYDKEFSKIIGNQESAIISPVFGGNTAQAEFEVLCGVPALHKYSSIEFNVFTGESVFCIPQLLKSSGYRVVATNSYKPNFFNTVNAYQGIGFDEIYFPKQYAPKTNTYLSLYGKEEFIFDGDLFVQNLAFLKAHLEQKDHQPILNYVLGVYGHMPFLMDEKRHPMRIKASVNKKALNNEFQRAVNQIYYRTQALATYLTELIKLDPNSLIIVMGDHVPKLSGAKFYKDMAYRNNEEMGHHKPAAFYVIDGKFIKKDGLHQYDMVNMMFNYLTDHQYCKDYDCQKTPKQLEYLYNMSMARALR